VTGSRTAVTAAVGLLATALATVLIEASPWKGVSLAGALLLACVPTGAGIMCWLDAGENAAQAGLILVLSLALWAIASTLMIWLSAWHPSLLFALAGASAVSCLVRLRLEVARHRGAGRSETARGAGADGSQQTETQPAS
jgi:Na+/proline symporter